MKPSLKEEPTMAKASHWEKVIGLIDRAKKDDSIRKVLAEGSVSQKTAVLEKAGIAKEDIEQICADLEMLAPRATGTDHYDLPPQILHTPWWIYWPPAGPK
jgi:hypothetical protein